MIIIPGFLISALTFPGVVVHELAHQLFCRIFRIPVFEVVYFRLGNPCGYVSHEAVDNPFQVFMTSMGPFFVNTLLGMLIVMPASLEIMTFRNFTNPLCLILGWLGISILMHAFPSIGDAKVMVNRILKNPEVGMAAKVLSAPFIGLVYVGAIGSMMWLDLIYAMAVAMIIPNLLVRLIW